MCVIILHEGRVLNWGKESGLIHCAEMKVICILPWKSILSKVPWQGRVVMICVIMVKSDFLQGYRYVGSDVSLPLLFL